MNSNNNINKKQLWYKVAEPGDLAPDRVMTVTGGTHQICLVNYKNKISALDNHCPHQGGPLGEGQIENGWVICPWHTSLHNPGFAEYAKLCGGEGIRITKIEQLESGIKKGLNSKKTSIVEIITDPLLI
jgi:thiamine pyrophosphate-dependent acetolactate synthase large subunit-like protein